MLGCFPVPDLIQQTSSYCCGFSFRYPPKLLRCLRVQCFRPQHQEDSILHRGLGAICILDPLSQNHILTNLVYNCPSFSLCQHGWRFTVKFGDPPWVWTGILLNMCLVVAFPKRLNEIHNAIYLGTSHSLWESRTKRHCILFYQTSVFTVIHNQPVSHKRQYPKSDVPGFSVKPILKGKWVSSEAFSKVYLFFSKEAKQFGFRLTKPFWEVRRESGEFRHDSPEKMLKVIRMTTTRLLWSALKACGCRGMCGLPFLFSQAWLYGINRLFYWWRRHYSST